MDPLRAIKVVSVGNLGTKTSVSSGRVTPDVRYALNGDVHLAYQVWGEGELDLVLVPGFISHVELLWEQPAIAHFNERLGSFARVIAFDRRGTGLSDPVTVTHAPDLDTRMSDIGAVMDAARSDRAVLYGMSEGGPTAALFAAMHPERTEALVLHGAMARSTWSDDHPWLRTVEDFTEAGVELLMPSWGRGVVIDTSAPSQAGNRDLVAWYGRLERAGISPGMIASVAAMFYDTDVRAVLPTISTPTLVLHRHGDRLVNVRSGRYLAEHIPAATFVEVPGIDHVPYYENPSVFLDTIEEFLTGTRPAVEPDRRLATVLFSDIVGSTERASDIGDAEVARASRTSPRGRPIRARPGRRRRDQDPRGRLPRHLRRSRARSGCATAIRAATEGIDVPVRIGLHCGEVEIIGDDIGGIAVHIAARIGALADSGEVLVSRTMKDLVAGSGISFESRGAHTLKGIPDEWEILAVVG